MTDTAIKAAKPHERPYKLSGRDGLVLLVNPSGSRWWRLRFHFEGKEKMLSLGTYPEVPLKRAREKRDEARRLLADGINPSAKRSAEKAAVTDTFEAVGREWFAKQKPNWAPSHSVKILARLEQDLFPWLGSRPVGANRFFK